MAKLDPNKQTSKPSPLQAFSWNPALAPQMQHLWLAEDSFLQQAERFSQHWFRRRHEAVEGAIRTGLRLVTEGMTNPTVGLQAMSDWQAASIRRLTEDAQEWTEVMALCSGKLMAEEIAAGSESIDAATAYAKGATATSLSEPV
jgi:hypothetical protein